MLAMQRLSLTTEPNNEKEKHVLSVFFYFIFTALLGKAKRRECLWCL